VAERDLTFFYVDLCSRQLELQIHEEAMSPAAHGTTNEPGDRKKQPMAFELRGGTSSNRAKLQPVSYLPTVKVA
jgi:hypothetical protein